LKRSYPRLLSSIKLRRTEKRPEIMPDKSITFGDYASLSMAIVGKPALGQHQVFRAQQTLSLHLSLSLSLFVSSVPRLRNQRGLPLPLSLSLSLYLSIYLSLSLCAHFIYTRGNRCMYTSTRCHSHHKGLRAPINPNYSYECCRPAAVTRRKVRPVHKFCRAGRTEFSMQFE